jgi:3-phosphoshikimate 1-carboxyvinyltransferase
MISFQKHDLTGQKTDCVPLYQYAFQLPAMAVLAAFAEGESIFRHLGDLRCSDPDGIAQIEACLKKIEVKLGSLPDGLVIKGGGNYDGFDVTERLPAPLAGACAMAGLHCQGSTTLNDELLSERWPGFEEMLTKLCEFRT